MAFYYAGGNLHVTNGEANSGNYINTSASDVVTVKANFDDSDDAWHTIGFWNSTTDNSCLLMSESKATVHTFNKTSDLQAGTNSFSLINTVGNTSNGGVSTDIDYVAFYKKLDLEVPQETRRIGYDTMTLHGKFRQYKVDTTKGDSLTYYSDGSPHGKYAMPSGNIKGGIEYPTFWSRLPLSIQPTPLTGTHNQSPACPDTHCENGLYSVHNSGTSQIFPKSYFTTYTDREKDANTRQATSGVYVAFETNSKFINLNYRYIMQSNAGSRAFTGIDIYEIENGTPKFKQNLSAGTSSVEGSFYYTTGSNGQTKKFMVMLPTYNGFKVDVFDSKNPSGLTFEIEKNASYKEIEVFGEKTKKPILIYGTSITQGDGNSNLRPGATYAAQIMFAAKREVINCGFAGSAQMEYKMADFLSNIDAEVFVIDPGWNLTGSGGSCSSNGAPANITDAEVVARAKYMVRKYREKHPNTPIVMCPKFLKRSDGCQNNNPQSLVSGVTLPTNIDTHSCYFSREGLLLYKAYLELKDPSCCPDEAGKKETPVQNLFWAKQNATSSDKTAANNYVNCTDLHPCVNGMNSIANFILGCFNENVRSVYTGGKFDAPEQCATCNKGHATN